MCGVLVRGSSTKAGKPFSGGSMKRLHGDTKCSQANWLLQKSGMPVKLGSAMLCTSLLLT